MLHYERAFQFTVPLCHNWAMRFEGKNLQYMRANRSCDTNLYGDTILYGGIKHLCHILVLGVQCMKSSNAVLNFATNEPPIWTNTLIQAPSLILRMTIKKTRVSRINYICVSEDEAATLNVDVF